MALTKVPSNLDSITATTQSASDNSTNVATTEYVTTAVSNLVDGAPSTLNTLNEIAAALNDDAALNTTLTTSIADKLPLGGGTLVGTLTLSYDYPRINLTDTNHDSDYSIINNNGEFGVYDVTNAAYRLQINSSGNLTVSGHITASGTNNIYVGDNGKFTAGGGDDLQIYHDGTNSHIYNNTGYTTLRTAASGGYLYLHGDNVHLRGQTANETLLTAVLNGAVTLYHDNTAKLTTGSNGVDVAGNIALTNSDNKSLRINSSTSNAGYLAVFQDQAIFSVNRDGKDGGFADTSKAAAVIKLNSAAADSNIEFQTTTTNNASPTTRLTIDKNGHVTLPGTSVIAGATIRSSGINASNAHLQLDNGFPWIDLVAPDGAYLKAGITARGGASSTQAQFHLHIARDSSYKKLSTADNYDTYLVTETANTAYGDLIFGTDLTEAMRISASNQYVGIGTSGPGAPLHVDHSSSTAYNGAAEILESVIIRNKNGTDDSGVNNVASLGFHVADGATSQGFINYIRTGNNTGNFTFSQRTGSSSYAEAMRIDSSGNVGIGAPSPSISALSGATSTRCLEIGNIGNDTASGIRLQGNNNTGNPGQSTTTEFIHKGDALHFHLRHGGSNAFVINHSRDFHFNELATDFRLRGGVYGSLFDSNPNMNHNIRYHASAGMYFNVGPSNANFVFEQQGTGRFTISSSGGSPSSDIKLKENIEDIDYGLDTVKQLRPRKFQWKGEDVPAGEKDDIGFIAQEVEAIIPEVVNENIHPDDPGDGSRNIKRLDYGHLTSVLVKAIQEQQEQIETLKQEVEELKGG